MKFGKSLLAVLTGMAVLASAPQAIAVETKYTGKATIQITGDEAEAYQLAQQKSRQEAVKRAIEAVETPDAARDPKVLEKLQAITDQISEDQIEETVNRMGSSIIVSSTIRLDDNDFRKVLRDQGIDGSGSKAAQSKILIVIDEYHTTPTELKVPAEEIFEYKASKGKSFSDKSVKASSSVAAGAAASSYKQDVNASASRSANVNVRESASYDGSASVSGRGGSASASESASASRSGSASASESASLKASTAASSSASAFNKSASASKTNVQSEEHDDVSIKRVVKYQPANKAPEKNRLIEAAFIKVIGGYQIETKSNDLFRSKYFKNKPLTFEQMVEGAALAQYVTAAKNDPDIDADFFMAGTATVIDNGVDAATGKKKCSGIVAIKAYATSTSTNLAAGEASETGLGDDIDSCAANVGRKLAEFAGEELSKAILDYWRNKQVFGQQYTVVIVADKIPVGVDEALYEVFTELGIEEPDMKEAGAKRIEFSVIYKGKKPLPIAVGSALRKLEGMPPLDKVQDGQRLTFCLGECAKLLRPAK
jgi:hypothetical protein